jgi:prepilin-type N-terminal cleavage/methylation domain-containing protein
MPGASCTTRIRGFTLLELVIVLVILGTLAAFAIPRFSPSDNTVAAQAERLARDLRHVQSLAMNQGRTLEFDVQSATTYRVTHGGNPVTDPATQQAYTVSLDNSVTLSGTDTAFDSLGRPVAAGSLLGTARVFTLSGTTRTATVNLAPVTGFVTVTP